MTILATSYDGVVPLLLGIAIYCIIAFTLFVGFVLMCFKRHRSLGVGIGVSMLWVGLFFILFSPIFFSELKFQLSDGYFELPLILVALPAAAVILILLGRKLSR